MNLFLFPLLLSATDSTQDILPTSLDETSLMPIHENASIQHSRPNKKLSKRNGESLEFVAFDLDQIESTGAFFLQKFKTTINIPVIGLPSSSTGTVGPTATMGFHIPQNLDKKLKSKIIVKFITDSAAAIAPNDISLQFSADIVKNGGEIVGGSLLPSQALGNTLTTVSRASTTTSANYFSASIHTTGLFKDENFVYLTITRDNSISTNYTGTIYIVSLELAYNLK